MALWSCTYSAESSCHPTPSSNFFNVPLLLGPCMTHNIPRSRYEEAISLLPMCAPLYTNLAAALAQADNGTRQYDAVCACDAAIKIDQSFLKARVRRATCLSALERHDEAVAEMGCG